jgi:hypothetical protein
MVAFGKILLILLVCGGVSLVLFLKYCSYQVLKNGGKPSEKDRDEDHRRRMAERMDMARVEQAVSQEQARIMQENSMFELHQEQVRQYFGTKVEIVRSITDMQHRIALVHADVARSRAESELRMVEHDHMARAGRGDDENGESARELAVLNTTRRIQEDCMLAQLRHLEQMRDDAERRLEVLDQQIRETPGPSMAGWVRHQLLEAASPNA